MTLQMERVSFSYRGREFSPHQAIREMSLTVSAGECVALIGEEGSGKTTVLRLLDGLLTPDGGSVAVGGIPFGVNPGLDVETRCRIGMAFQHPEEQFVAETVALDFAEYLSRRKCPEGERGQRTLTALATLGLKDRVILDRSPFTLSPGEARLVSLGQIISGQPEAVLLDEPTAALDARGIRCMERAVRQLLESGAAMVVATHDIDFAAEVATRVVLIKDGSVVADGPSGAILGNEALLREHGYDMPEAVAVAAMMTKAGLLPQGSIINRSALLQAVAARKV
jgi:energy-coupling factor transporter ATP-binding protein EcfA2